MRRHCAPIPDQTLRAAAAEVVSGQEAYLLEDGVATTSGNRPVTQRRHSPCHNPLKAVTCGVRAPFEWHSGPPRAKGIKQF